jgi:CubicO group peptidase (beta-lactamase class C family)
MFIGTLSLILAAQVNASEITQQSLAAQIDVYVEPFVEGRNFSGAILIAKGGHVLFSKGYGTANYELTVQNRPDTRFHIASISMSFTAAAILMLEERGNLHVQDTLAKFIPRLSGRQQNHVCITC